MIVTWSGAGPIRADDGHQGPRRLRNRGESIELRADGVAEWTHLRDENVTIENIAGTLRLQPFHPVWIRRANPSFVEIAQIFTKAVNPSTFKLLGVSGFWKFPVVILCVEV